MTTLLVDKGRELADAAVWADENRALLCEVAASLLAGCWPTVDSLGRAALRSGDERDVYAAMRSIPAPFGHITATGHIVLRVRGLALCPAAEPVLEGFVRVMQLAVLRLISEDPSPKLLSHDLSETLGMSEQLAELVGSLVLEESWMLGGGSGDAETGWVREITEHTRFMRGVSTIDDYLRAEQDRFWAGTTNVTLGRSPRGGIEAKSARPSDVPALDIAGLHPRIAAATERLVTDEHYDAAVHRGAVALQELLQERTGLSTLDGCELAGRALGGPSPLIQLVADISTKKGKGEQQGWLNLAQGVFGALRNPVAHRSVGHNRIEAVERLATMSLIARRVDIS